MGGQGREESPMDWSKFEEYFQHIFPSALPKQNDSAWLKEWIGTSMGKGLEHVPFAFAGSQPEVFETHRLVVVRANVPDPARLDHMRIRLSENVLLLEGLRREEVRLPLPAAVKPRTARAVYRDGVLQITARKRYADISYHEVPIAY
ncbi:hypothetical protein DUZ99_03095 [Xylanibacillus composti]|uniref:Hsp20/alpha crystallin family protein n=1 Tax=Xylanibacillus composti TaxID=1572762 RepID=A0A8J4M1U8_9BACL|nr:Hsp20/alpha crystallin family protein [Xylanibacillus composti]MDT9723985.1 hypothetical protein [Xylanibacillus composti]GIQ67866.1 hypothetical protein XYCOK13_06900 [Xylanibacillus composti]